MREREPAFVLCLAAQPLLNLCSRFEGFAQDLHHALGMAFTSQDLAAIDAAIASGELTVRTADGKLVTLRTMAELLQARAVIVGALASGSGAAPRPYPRHQLADFSD